MFRIHRVRVSLIEEPANSGRPSTRKIMNFPRAPSTASDRTTELRVITQRNSLTCLAAHRHIAVCVYVCASCERALARKYISVFAFDAKSVCYFRLIRCGSPSGLATPWSWKFHPDPIRGGIAISPAGSPADIISVFERERERKRLSRRTEEAHSASNVNPLASFSRTESGDIRPVFTPDEHWTPPGISGLVLLPRNEQLTQCNVQQITL